MPKQQEPDNYDGEIDYKWKPKIPDELDDDNEGGKFVEKCMRCSVVLAGKPSSIYEDVYRYEDIIDYEVCESCGKMIEEWKKRGYGLKSFEY